MENLWATTEGTNILVMEIAAGAERKEQGKVLKKTNGWDFPGSTVVKNPPANARDTGSILGLGRSHMLGSN